MNLFEHEHLTHASLEDHVKTYHAKPGEVEREWLLVDATDMVLGRLASEVAQILQGQAQAAVHAARRHR